MRVTIGVKIFGIAVGLLILMAVVALLSGIRPVAGEGDTLIARFKRDLGCLGFGSPKGDQKPIAIRSSRNVAGHRQLGGPCRACADTPV